MAGGSVFFVNQWTCFVENMKSNSRYDYLLRWSTKIVKPQLVIWQGKNKKAANRKGLAAQDRSVSYFFYGLYI